MNTAVPPVFSMPERTLSERTGAEMRESCPTAIRTESFSVFPARAFSQRQKAAAMFSARSAVRSTSSPATPSEAIPRTSVPFLSLRYSCKSAITDKLPLDVLMYSCKRPVAAKKREFFPQACEYYIICFYYNVFQCIFQAFYTKFIAKIFRTGKETFAGRSRADVGTESQKGKAREKAACAAPRALVETTGNPAGEGECGRKKIARRRRAKSNFRPEPRPHPPGK